MSRFAEPMARLIEELRKLHRDREAILPGKRRTPRSAKPRRRRPSASIDSAALSGPLAQRDLTDPASTASPLVSNPI